MVTADDEQTTDIITSGDVEETTRFCRVRCHADTETTMTVFCMIAQVKRGSHLRLASHRLCKRHLVLHHATGTRPPGEGQGVCQGHSGAVKKAVLDAPGPGTLGRSGSKTTRGETVSPCFKQTAESEVDVFYCNNCLCVGWLTAGSLEFQQTLAIAAVTRVRHWRLQL